MALRLASTADIELIRTLAHRIWWAHYPPIIGDAQVTYMLEKMYSVQALEQQMTEGHQFWLGYLDEYEPALGFMSVSEKQTASYFLNKFYIDNQQRGRGLGAVFFQEMLGKYPELQEIRLTVNRKNFKSINFYFKIGFVIEQCVDMPIGEGYVMEDFVMIYARNR